MERTISGSLASTSGRTVAFHRTATRPKFFRLRVNANLLDNQADRQVAKMKKEGQKAKGDKSMNGISRKDVEDMIKLMPDPATDESLLADDDPTWGATADALQSWDGIDGADSLLSPGSLSSLPFGEAEAAEAAAAASEGLPTYRNSSLMGMGVRSPYNGPMAPLATGMTTELTPEQAALEQYLMEQAVDEGMKLHHARLEAAHSRFAASLRFADFLEEVENEDVRRGAAPLLAGTGQKMPSWIRASEVMAPEMELLNEAMRDLEEKASAAELQRAHDAILDEVDMAARLLAETDPQAGISLDDSADSPEALDALFWDEDALLPGLKSTPEEEKVDDMLTEYLKELLPGTTDNLEVADIYGGMGTGGVDIVASSLQGLSGHVSSVLEEVGALNKDEGGSEEEELEAAEVDVEGSFEGDHAEDPEAWAAAKAATGHITDDE